MRMGLFLDALTKVAKTDVLVVPLGGVSKYQAGLDEQLVASCKIIPTQGREDTLFRFISRIQNPAERLSAFRSYGRSSLTAGLSAEVMKDIAAATEGQSYDLVHVGRTYLAEVGLAVGGSSLKTIDADENDALVFQRQAALALASGDEYGSCLYAAEASACERHQLATLGQFDRAFASSEREAQSLMPLPKTVDVVPNAVTRPHDLRRLDDGNTLLFVGSLSFWPNRDGLKWLVSEVWPSLARVKPNLKLLIVGRDCPSDIRHLDSIPGISVHADVASLDEIYSRATLAIVPLRAGGGTRIKLIEAALFGVPAVATRIGAEELSFEDDREIWLATDAQEMVRRILFALDNPALARELGARAQRLALANYGFEKVRDQLACIWKDLLAKNKLEI